MFSTNKDFIKKPKTYNRRHAAKFQVDPRTDDGQYITDMFYQMSGDKYHEFGGLCFIDFIFVLIKELKVGREKKYVRLYLYPLEADFTNDYFAIFIRKKDLYVVRVQDVNKAVYEIGQHNEKYRYFHDSQTTGFGQSYEFLFSGSHGNLFGIWVGYDVLNEAIMRVILQTAGNWAWSIGIFALMFSECSRFVWYCDKLPEIMEARQNIRMMGQYRFMKVLPKFWTEISNCARNHLEAFGPQTNKYTERGALDLQDIGRWAREALKIKSWEYGDNANNGPDGHIHGDGDGDGYGDGGGTYPPYHRGDNNVAPGRGRDHGGRDTGGENRGGGRRGDGHRGHGAFQAKTMKAALCFESLSNMVVIVLMKSLSAIAKKRPAFYGRTLPVILGLDPSSPAVKAGHVSGVHAFLSCLKYTHPGAVPWRDRLVGSLRDMKASGLAEEALREVSWSNSSIAQDVKPSVEASNSPGIRKRSQVQDVSDLHKDDGVPGKHAKPTLNLNEDSKGNVDGNTSSQKVNADNGRVHQLVSMFSSLVAQGEQSAGMLEILISRISAVLLAQVVMANMPNLPLVRPIEDGNEELVNTGSHPAITQADNLSAYLTDIISSSTNSQLTDSTLETQIDEKPEMEGEQPVTKDRDAVHSPQASPVSVIVTNVSLAIPSEDTDLGELEDGIPGLDSSARDDGMPEIQVDAAMEENNQEQITKMGTSSMDIVPSISTDRSEELSPKAAMVEANSINSSTATSVQLTSKVILPKMAAPVISLTDEQKDHIQKLAFTRIIEAYKHIAVAGGSDVRFSLLSYLGVELMSH